VDALFGGVLCSSIRCGECGYVSTTYEPFLDLSLPIPAGAAGGAAAAAVRRKVSGDAPWCRRAGRAAAAPRQPCRARHDAPPPCLSGAGGGGARTVAAGGSGAPGALTCR
jgi:hypothetical protein